MVQPLPVHRKDTKLLFKNLLITECIQLRMEITTKQLKNSKIPPDP